MTESELIERLAENAHNIWASWMQWMFKHGGHMCKEPIMGHEAWEMYEDKYERWQRQANTPYVKLSEEEKESDRKVAHKHLEWLIEHIRESRDSWEECIRKGDSQIEALEKRNDELQNWIDDLQSGMYINCVYCGHRYGPNPETPVAMADILEAHIEQCSKHPLSHMKVRAEKAEGQIEELQKENDRLTVELISSIAKEKDFAAALEKSGDQEAKLLEQLEKSLGSVVAHLKGRRSRE